MDLQIKDVAELLNVTESTVKEWISEGKIPAYKLGEQYRFSRGEIEEWLVRNHPHVQVDAEPHKGRSAFNLYRAINKGGIHIRVPGKTKEDLILNASHEIAKNLPIDPETISELLCDRERLMTTALNEGLAVPHTREIVFSEPFDAVALVYPTEPIEWGALDEKKVDLLFFLFASDDRKHLNLLAKIAHLSRDPKAVATLRSRPSPQDTLNYIKEWESKIKS